MSNKYYIEQDIEDLIMSDEIFKSFKKEHKTQNIYNISIINLATLILRFIKYAKGNFNFSYYDYNKFNKSFIEIKNLLSKEEIESFNNFILLMNRERDYNRENVFINLLQPSYAIFMTKQLYVYQKITMLEEQQRINENIKYF